MRLIILLFYLLLIVFGVSFAALNSNVVEVNFYLTTLHLPISLCILLALGIGILIGYILSIFKYWRVKIINSKIKKQLELTEREIKNLRTIPIRNDDTAF